jgi:preprotein translocase subunit SecG
MGFFAVLLFIIFVIVCLLLIFLVIIQDEDNDSIGGVFAGGSGSAFGSRSSNVVIRITYVLGALFFVTAFTLAIINKTSTGNVEKIAVQQSQSPTNTEWWKTETPEGQEAPAEATGEGTTATTVPAN